MKRFEKDALSLSLWLVSFPGETYEEKVSHLPSSDYLHFQFGPVYDGYVYHASDGFLLERVFNGAPNPSSFSIGPISYAQYRVIKEWMDEFPSRHQYEQLAYVYNHHRLRYLLSENC